MDKEQYEIICSALSDLYAIHKSLEEKIECVLHTLCENDDDKTHKSICKYIGSDYRNTKNR